MPKKTILWSRAHAFISVHVLVTPYHPWPHSCLPLKSTFTGFRVLQSRPCKSPTRVVCGISPSAEDPNDREVDSTQGGESVPHYFVTYESWRNPKWLHHYQEASPEEESTASHPESSPPFFQLPNEDLALKLTCSAALLSLLGLLSLAYIRLNILTQQTLQIAVASGLSRELHVGRVVRCNPITGIKLHNVSLPVSAAHPTAPVISASDVEITLSGFLRAIFMRRALRVNVRLDGANIRVSQVVVDGPKGDLVGQWDPGVYFTARDRSGAETGQQELKRILRFLQPGRLSIRNARVFLQPADYLDYGHGDEIVEVEGASADVTFPVFKVAHPQAKLPVEMDGDFQADVRGTPVDGGTIEVQCEINGNALPDLKPEDPFVSLRVAGEGVHANRVASFLNLPFRADEGLCAADISMDFLYNSKSLVPLMRGEAQLNSIALRFHPDPKTPEFRHIDGKLRFEGKTLFLDGPVGALGTLPMTVVGDIHLEDGYNLKGYVRPVDVNTIIDTFDVDKFVPVLGLVTGEIQLSGLLEEPVVTGSAESVGEKSVFDRLPLKTANMSFEWDAIAGILKFSEISAKVKGGGSVSGSGSMFFDMTKESPYGITQAEHSPRSPKALYWNPNSRPQIVSPLRPLPRDELEIDEQAPFRPYDSMRFDFKVVDVNGGDLLKFYGGEYGQMAMEAVGLVSGEGVVAGHAKDANCRAVWRSTTPPPPVQLLAEGWKGSDGGKTLATKLSDSNEVPQRSETRRSGEGPLGNNQGGTAGPQASMTPESNDSMLGGGDFRGLVYLKLGDLPDARRVKVRTAVKNFDARRAGWTDPYLRKILAHSPLLEVSMDTYFKGVMSQRPILMPGQNKTSRTPRMELLGADGALAVKNLTMNNVRFENVMSGSFSFSISDFSMSLKEVVRKTAGMTDRGEDFSSEADRTQAREQNELTVAASRKGTANLCFRLGSSEMIASVSKNEQDHQTAAFFARNVVIEDFVGDDTSFSSGESLAGVVNADMKLDLTSRRGDGNLSLERPRVGPMKFSSVVGNIVWRDNDLYLEGGTVKYRRSVYKIDARYSASSSDEPEFGWEVNVNIPRASIHDVAKLIQSGNDVATAMQSPADKISRGRPRYSGGPVWIQRLSQSGRREEGTVIEDWEVPEGLSFPEQMDWFHQYLEDKENIMKLTQSRLSDNSASRSAPMFADVEGDISGRVTLKYNSRSGEVRYNPSNASAVLQAILDQLTRTSFSFHLGGTDWRVGPARLNKVVASGTFEDGVLNIGPFTCEGKDGFGAEALGRITSAGSVKSSVILRKAPAALVNQFSQAPVDVTGECNGRLEVEGNISNPRAFGRMVWTDATLNGKQVRGAKTDLACVNGRCILNADAKIGGRKVMSQQESDDAGIRSLQWGENVLSGLKDLATQVSSKAEAPQLVSNKSDRRGLGESMQVRISAPVRFYLLKYLQRRAPTSFWSELEPVLGGSLPSDDEWVLMDVDVKKYGLVLLNTALPELGWESGDSDIRLRVSGTLAKPVVSGRVSVRDGRVSPKLLSEPLQGLRGEIDFSENGLMSFKSLAGRCNGKSINMNGDIFFSDDHRETLSDNISGYQVVLQSWKPADAANRKKRKSLIAKQSAAKAALQRGSRGVTVEFGEFPVNLDNIVVSKLSGKVQLAGTAARPVIGGALTFSDGLISVGNAAVAPRSIARIRGKNDAMTELLQSVETDKKQSGSRHGDREGAHTGDQNENEVALNLQQAAVVNGNRGIRLDGLRVNLGRNMQVVQPFVLNLDTNGSLVLDGSPTQPEIEGEIRVLRGRVNMLATRMSVRKDAKNYVKFVKSDESSGAGKAPEPLINVTLEGQDLVVRIPECGLSTWADHLVVADKSGMQLSEATMSALVQSELGEVRSAEGVARLLAKYAAKAVEAGGKAGALEWRVFPALVSKTGGYSPGNLRDELGAGAEFEIGGLAIGAKRSADGTHGGRVKLRLWDWLNLQLEKEGMKHTSSIEVVITRLQKGLRRKEKTDVDGVKTKEAVEEGAENEQAEQQQQVEEQEQRAGPEKAVEPAQRARPGVGERNNKGQGAGEKTTPNGTDSALNETDSESHGTAGGLNKPS